MMNHQTVEVEYSLGDLYSLNLQMWRRPLVIIFIVVGLLIGIQLIFAVSDGEAVMDVFASLDWKFPLLVALGLTALQIMLTLPNYWIAKRRRDFVPTRYMLSDEGVKLRNEYVDSTIFWNSLKKVTATRDRLFLFISSSYGFILPKRCFADQADFQLWVEFSKRRWAETRVSDT